MDSPMVRSLAQRAGETKWVFPRSCRKFTCNTYPNDRQIREIHYRQEPGMRPAMESTLRKALSLQVPARRFLVHIAEVAAPHPIGGRRATAMLDVKIECEFGVYRHVRFGGCNVSLGVRVPLAP